MTVEKLDAASGAAVAGAVIEVRAQDGGAAIATMTTSDAPARLELPPGGYLAREIGEPAGYLIDDPADRPFSVTMLGGELRLVWEDTAAAPTMSTRASAARIVPGSAVRDVITVAGLPPSLPPFPVQVRYLGPVPPPADGDCTALSGSAFADAAVVAQTKAMVTGNGDFPTGTFTAPATPGCTTFDVTSSAPLWAGGPILSAPPNAANESIEVVAVSISTSISTAVVAPGESVSDLITVQGMPAWAGPRTFSVILIGPVPAPSSGQCADLPGGAFAQAPALASTTMTIVADGSVASPQFPVTARDGECITFEIADTRPLWPGGPTLASPRGLPDETALVRDEPSPPIAPAPTPDSPVRSAAPHAPAAPPDASQPALANTGPVGMRTLLAAAAALMSGGIGLLLLVPGSSGRAAGDRSSRCARP